jgi:hypothetical protein
MKKHKIDKIFSDKLEDYQSQPRPEAWATLEESLAQQSPKQVWAWISIAASAVLVAASSWYILSADSSTPLDEYAYTVNPTEELDVPKEIVLVPIFIQVPVNNIALEKPISIQKHQVANNDEGSVELEKDTEQVPTVLADNKVLEHQLAPIIQEPLPLDADDTEELIIASSKETTAQDQTNTLEPLTIIYKQGEPEAKSNFTKALDYMEDVRKGDKRLVNFKKIGESIKSKFKSNKDVNSK